MNSQLEHLRIDRTKPRRQTSRRNSLRWTIAVVVPVALLGGWHVASQKLNVPRTVEIQRIALDHATLAPQGVVLNATGYVVAAHKIEVAAKVVGKVKWIGVDKGDHVREGDVIVRLEDD